MFATLKAFFSSLFNDMQGTFIWLFTIGMLICGLMAWLGDEANQSKFKKALVFCIWGLVIFLLAKPIITYVDSKL